MPPHAVCGVLMTRHESLIDERTDLDGEPIHTGQFCVPRTVRAPGESVA